MDCDLRQDANKKETQLIPVTPVPAPPDWESKGRKLGEDWLATHPVASRPLDKPFRPRNLWSAFCGHLSDGFESRCGYTATYVPNGTIDHYIPWEDVAGTPNENLAYDWSNFRYADGWFNSARKRMPVPDPYRVGVDWFRISLPDLQLYATDQVPSSEAQRVSNVLKLLRDDLRVMKTRRKWYSMYRTKKLSLEGLHEVAPMIAAALERQPEFLLPADRPVPSTGASK